MTNGNEILKSAQLRKTPVRMGVVALLAGADRPRSVQDLVDHLPSGTDTVTVYRTLNTLVAKGLARKVRGEDRSWRFELIDTDRDALHIHAHFVCDGCGVVECLQDVAVPTAVPDSAKLRAGYQITQQEVTLHGTCPKCH